MTRKHWSGHTMRAYFLEHSMLLAQQYHSPRFSGLYRLFLVLESRRYLFIYYSAARGSLALMSTAFTLFSMAFILPGAMQGVLAWASTMPTRTKFSSRKKYNIIIGIMLTFGWVSTFAAVYILLLSVYFLPVSRKESTGAEFSSATRWSSVAAIAALSFSSCLVLGTNMMVLLQNGWGLFINIHFHNQDPKQKKPTDFFPL
jgi:hypothetical protein